MSYLNLICDPDFKNFEQTIHEDAICGRMTDIFNLFTQKDTAALWKDRL